MRSSGLRFSGPLRRAHMRSGDSSRLPLLEIAGALVRLNQIANGIVNANHCRVRSTVKLRVLDCVIRPGIPQPTEWQRIGD